MPTEDIVTHRKKLSFPQKTIIKFRSLDWNKRIETWTSVTLIGLFLYKSYVYAVLKQLQALTLEGKTLKHSD